MSGEVIQYTGTSHQTLITKGVIPLSQLLEKERLRDNI